MPGTLRGDTAKDDSQISGSRSTLGRPLSARQPQCRPFRRLRTQALEALALALAIFVPSYALYESANTARIVASKAQEALLRARAQAIADRAEYVLGNEGPAKALVVAAQAEKLGLPDLPKTERVLIAGLRQLRERRVISGLWNQPSGIAYSPDGSVIASLDNASVVFRGADKGDFMAAVSLTAPGKFGLTWSAGGDWIGVNNESTETPAEALLAEGDQSFVPDVRARDPRISP